MAQKDRFVNYLIVGLNPNRPLETKTKTITISLFLKTSFLVVPSLSWQNDHRSIGRTRDNKIAAVSLTRRAALDYPPWSSPASRRGRNSPYLENRNNGFKTRRSSNFRPFSFGSAVSTFK